MRDRFTRQRDIITPEQLNDHRYTVIGAGGIGSPTVQELTNLGVGHLTVYDFDRVELHNLPTQKYRLQDIGAYKVDALSDIVQEATGVTLTSYPERYDDQLLNPVVISAVDSMRTRKSIWEQVKEQAGYIRFYVEARMGAELARIYTLTGECIREMGERVDLYEDTLYSDEEAVQVACTARATSYNTSMIASLVTNQIKRFATGQETHREIIFDFVTMTLMAV